MKRYFTTLLFFLISIFSFSQNNTQDVVYLKNGSIIHGIIVERIPSKTIKIKTENGNIFVYKLDNIKKIEKESVTKNDNNIDKNNNIIINQPKEAHNTNKDKTNKFLIGTGLGIHIPTRSKQIKLGFGFQISVAYFINNKFSLGLMIGHHRFSIEAPSIFDNKLYYRWTPIILSAYIHMPNEDFSFFGGFDIGIYHVSQKFGIYHVYYNEIEFIEYNEMDFGFAPTFGLNINISKNFDIIPMLKLNVVVSSASTTTALGLMISAAYTIGS